MLLFEKLIAARFLASWFQKAVKTHAACVCVCGGGGCLANFLLGCTFSFVGHAQSYIYYSEIWRNEHFRWRSGYLHARHEGGWWGWVSAAFVQIPGITEWEAVPLGERKNGLYQELTLSESEDWSGCCQCYVFSLAAVDFNPDTWSTFRSFPQILYKMSDRNIKLKHVPLTSWSIWGDKLRKADSVVTEQ
jgi:hypothetical protein